MDLPIRHPKRDKQINVHVDQETIDLAERLKSEFGVQTNQFAYLLLKDHFQKALTELLEKSQAS